MLRDSLLSLTLAFTLVQAARAEAEASATLDIDTEPGDLPARCFRPNQSLY